MPAIAQSGPATQEVIDPQLERREINTPAIDTEDFEIGAYVGILSIQDFDSEVVYGATAAWHMSEDFFFEANYGSSKGDLTSFEELSGGSPLFEDDERDYTFYNVNFGWNALPGEVFLWGKRALKSDLYFILGGGNTDFLGDNWITLSAGVGYKLLLNDAFALRIDVRDNLFDRDTFGEDEITHNISLTAGLSFFF